MNAFNKISTTLLYYPGGEVLARLIAS